MQVEFHVTGRKQRWLFYLKAGWIVATASVLLVGLGACVVGEDPCFEAGQSMEGFMFLLSFPSSILFFVWSPLIYGWESIHYPGNYFLLWLGVFLVGYLQWFVLIPRLFAGPVITSLNLTAGLRSKRSSRRRRKKRSFRVLGSNGLKPFDAEGKTPLERVFRMHD